MNVKNVHRIVYTNNNGYIEIKNTLKSQTKHYKGYMTISLKKDGKQYKKYIHRLVAETFIPNPENLPQINHKDENKENNFVGNLEWCTNTYNLNYGTRLKRLSESLKKRKSTSHNAKKVLYNNVVYDSINKAAKDNNTTDYYIIKKCNDIKNNECKFL